ncbi:MAG: hypothetical protein CO128_09725 [Ignavibacteriales bacterium CG_4_9_14_3_um_filter_30_11]|nr:MAG: hypothetical protein CO128_09725 [Ignavibacteriales bacterium CG_4_9_14_3_um_filter_30_11]
MKKLIFIIIVLFIPSLIAQNKMKIHKDQMNKFEQLEKLKLIEVLNLDEETTLRFFARLNEHRKKMEGLKKEADNILDKMNELINDKDKKAELNKNINSYLALGEKVTSTRSEFINSLRDILTEEQITKFLIFEMKFREDIKGMLFKMRKKSNGMFP